MSPTIILDQSLEIILKIPQQEELKYYRTKVPHKEVKDVLLSLQKYLKLLGEVEDLLSRKDKINSTINVTISQ